MTRLFDEFTLRGVTFRNRTVVSPMCQYSAEDGIVSDFHLVHLGRFAMGGFGLVMGEATAISPEGRLTHRDVGLWRDDQARALSRVADLVHAQGARFGVQLGHAGPKAATLSPWESEVDRPEGSLWEIFSVVDEPYAPGWRTPIALTPADLERQLDQWRAAALRAADIGVDVLELHMAHGYLLHQFLSPLSNTRADEFGGSEVNRMRFPLRVVRAIREVWPKERPLFARLSVVDNGHDGISVEQSISFAQRLKEFGVDLIDCSSGGIGGPYLHGTGAGYQFAWAHEIRARAGVPTMAVGLVRDPQQADGVIAQGVADLVALGREALMNPAWPVQAREVLGQYDEPDRFDLLPVPSRSWIRKRVRQLSHESTTPALTATSEDS